jgi:hypothetical protein
VALSVEPLTADAASGRTGRLCVMLEWDRGSGDDGHAALEFVVQPGHGLTVHRRTVAASACDGGGSRADAIAAQPVGATVLELALPPGREDDNRRCTVGWTLRGHRLSVWAVGGTDDGARTTVTAAAAVDVPHGDDNEEPVRYWLAGTDAAVHEIRLTAPAPSADTWVAVVEALDARRSPA